MASPVMTGVASAQAPVVRAVLFFSPTCGHCEYVINELLFPVWFPEFGGEPEVRYDDSLDEVAFYLGTNGTLEVLFVDVQAEAGRLMHRAVGEALGIPEARLGSVPRLVVGDRYLIGSGEIPDEFPGIVEAGLAGGGIDWPDIPGMAEALAAVAQDGTPGSTTTTGAGPTTTADGTTTTAESPATTAAPSTTNADGNQLPLNDWTWRARFEGDQPANSIALVVLGLMLLSIVGAGWWGVGARRDAAPGGPGWAVPVVALIGLGIAAYLASVETSGGAAVCGVGDCNAVQQSEWAKLFGVIHIGIIGVAGFAAVLAAWALARFGPTRAADWARVVLLAGSAGGVAFSVYLTFLEPFVIGHTCLWCLGSAVVVTVLLWLTARPGWRRGGGCEGSERRDAPSAGGSAAREESPSTAAAGEGQGRGEQALIPSPAPPPPRGRRCRPIRPEPPTPAPGPPPSG